MEKEIVMQLSVTNVESGTCLELEGIVSEEESTLIMNRLLKSKNYKVSIDMGKVDTMDTGIVQILRTVNSTMRHVDRRLCFANAPERVVDKSIMDMLDDLEGFVEPSAQSDSTL